MKDRRVNEFSALVAGIVNAAQAAAGNSDGVDVTDLITTWSPLIAVARDSAVADVLDSQAEFYWEASTLLDPAKSVADANGEEAMSAILDSQIRTMREVATRLRRRAAEWRGVSAEDQAIHAMAAAAAPAEPVEVKTGGLTEVMGAITAAYLAEHPELDMLGRRVSFVYREGDQGWYVANHTTEAEPCCACCAVGDGKCYCEGPKAKMCKCAPCVQARKDLK